MSMNSPNDHTVATTRTTRAEDQNTKEALVGTDRRGSTANVSWGAIFAGVVTFLAVTVLLSLVTAGIGLTGAGVGAGIWSIVALALALAAAGFVAGALAVRSGLLHGFLTWATSLVAALVLTVWLSASALGAVSGALGQVVDLGQGDVSEIVQDVQENVDEQDVENAQQQAEEAAEDAQPAVWWTFVGMLLGAAVAAGSGLLGARTVITRSERVTTYSRTQP
ncbi:hypothetical protein K0817_018230 [Microbacterium sp. HD4P20]|uniref:hypothetical protein n=1 Tax=Microbacterium sp. HD4P20 TaxID=2864874 RepID=UPI001C63EFF6|nr:hypothetical protein [Microbacterium sp. HD4P20]MCP2638496.1 hypothetical protein [Microbacterium sp. HD4P20]